MSEPRDCPTPGACSAEAEIAALRARVEELEQDRTVLALKLQGALDGLEMRDKQIRSLQATIKRGR